MIYAKAQNTRTLFSIPRQGTVLWRGETYLWDLGWLTCLWGFGGFSPMFGVTIRVDFELVEDGSALSLCGLEVGG